MIVHLKHDEIDRERWDDCIRNTPGAKPYGYSWYLDIMAPEWEALAADDYHAVFPLPAFKKFGIRYLATPTFVQQLGVFSPDKTRQDTISDFLKYIPGFYKLVDLRVGQQVSYEGFKVAERTNYELNLSNSYETLWNNFSPGCKKNIEKSTRYNPEIIGDITTYELISLFRSTKRRIKGVRDSDYLRLNTLMDFCIRNKKGRIVGVRSSDNKLIYGRFFLVSKELITMLFTAGTSESRKKNTGYYVVSEIIREYSGSNTTFDFEGSMIPSIASFMNSFGCVNVPYYRIYRNRLPWPIKYLK
jgi:hypothetical protein